MSKLKLADAPTLAEREQMHELYRLGGQERSMAPHVVYQEAGCPLGVSARSPDKAHSSPATAARSWLPGIPGSMPISSP
jgi:hypothetical protein